MANSLYPDRGIAPESPLTAAFTRVVACVGSGEFTDKMLRHAGAVAKALGLPLLLLRVCEIRAAGNQCLDPVDWEIRRREAYARVESLLAGLRQDDVEVEAEVLEGKAAEQICLWAQEHPSDLLVLGTHGEWQPANRSLGSTVREVIDRAVGSLLLVPDAAADVPVCGYRRLLVPMDGSCRAESVLPVAIHLAQTQHAELLLVHVVPPSLLTEVGPVESEDVELCERLLQRNERVARQYLERLQSRASEKEISVCIRLLSEDVRSSLARAATEEAADLIVLSAQGCSGRVDVLYGGVTSFLMTHTVQPLLIIRPQALPGGLDHASQSAAVCYRSPEAW
ncbi:MAG: universal stress protein [Pseudomonas sp.]|nr:universal stress protein [Pseudomonas sp.]